MLYIDTVVTTTSCVRWILNVFVLRSFKYRTIIIVIEFLLASTIVTQFIFASKILQGFYLRQQGLMASW